MMNINFSKYQNCIPLILRIGLGLIFLVFGVDKLFRPDYWAGWVPSWVILMLPVSMKLFMYVQGVIEGLIGLGLVLGLFTRKAALAAALLLTGIMGTLVINNQTIGHYSMLHFDKDIFPLLLNETLLRDFGLLAIAISLIISGGGDLSLDGKIKKKVINS